VITVDGIDQPMGHVALVLGLRAASAGRFGNYGTGEGATLLIPDMRFSGGRPSPPPGFRERPETGDRVP
ncbi:MAG: copper transporter, partial [Actinomycetota bacterium]